jgi:hypothetical protein
VADQDKPEKSPETPRAAQPPSQGYTRRISTETTAVMRPGDLARLLEALTPEARAKYNLDASTDIPSLRRVPEAEPTVRSFAKTYDSGEVSIEVGPVDPLPSNVEQEGFLGPESDLPHTPPFVRMPEDIEPSPKPAEPATKAPPRGPSAVEMESRFADGDYEGAMVIAEAILERDPENDAARECRERCDLFLVTSYTTELIRLDRIPVRLPQREEHKFAQLDHRMGFVLALVDGRTTIEDIVDGSGLSKLEALRLLADLARRRVIDLL